jgi:hypothetical protein
MRMGFRRQGWGRLAPMFGLLMLAGSAEAAPSRSRAAPTAASASKAGKAKATVPAQPRPEPSKATAVDAAAASPSAAPTGRGSEVRVEASAAEKAALVKTEEAEKGVKTYTFGAQEVEGRLRSPQILYFLRRVRAEFDPQPLGHRSFLLELSDTRHQPALK